MGNCLGSRKQDPDGSIATPLPGVFDVDVISFDNNLTSILSIEAAAAHYAASSERSTYSVMHRASPHTLLVGIFEGGSVATAICHKNAVPAFAECCQRHGLADYKAVLSETLHSLHAACLQAKSMHPGRNGVSAAVALLDLRSELCTVAGVGQAQGLISTIIGSFNARRPGSTWALPSNFSLHKEPAASERDLLPLGTPVGKLKVTARVHTLPQTDFSVILASSGVWSLLSPSSVALRAHLHTQFRQKHKAAVQQASAAADSALPSPAMRSMTTAEHMVHAALATAADRHPTAGEHFSAADLHSLPFERPAPAETLEGAGNTPLLKQRPVLIRGDIHGDLSCTIISVSASATKQLSNPIPRLFTSSATPSNNPSSDLAAVAHFRWSQLRMLAVDYLRLSRREARQRWAETADAAMKEARKRAKLAECLRMEQVDSSLKLPAVRAVTSIAG